MRFESNNDLGVSGWILVILISFILVFFSPALGALFGAFAGYVVSLVCPIWVTTGLNILGFKDINPSNLIEVGAGLGFFGGFFRSYLSTTREKKK